MHPIPTPRLPAAGRAGRRLRSDCRRHRRGGRAGSRVHATTKVKAVETDFHIALSKKSFKAGKYVFNAVNKGQTTHALMITGPGIKMAMTKDIQPGQSATLAVTLRRAPTTSIARSRGTRPWA